MRDGLPPRSQGDWTRLGFLQPNDTGIRGAETGVDLP
jgi:hypothetical protein